MKENFPQSTQYKSRFHRNSSIAIAETVINELYSYVKLDPKIMVINWLLYAYEFICKESSAVIGCECGNIESFFTESDKYQIQQVENLIENKLIIEILRAWHDYHSLRASLPEFENEYNSYLTIRELKLPNFTLA